ncbi:small glutamine-rich tetratricopeptide repeat-containing protein alpha-like [Culicoides brevitarsis]|uniref:small glutamine-rich tetratricopeptide repeat-containing protein alpha-like n=1 Tax=Culicoides brevitarsis TaxID=469753 RepID=UPI00307B87D3
MINNETRFFVRSFVRFLNKQIADGQLGNDSVESLEVVIQCLENVYEFNDETGADEKDNPINNFDLYELYSSTLLNVTPERKEEAESMKNEGNRLMKEEKYQEALNMYNKAIALDATNAVFYCNRAAAFSRIGDYNRAAEDCKMSLKYDPKYSKAYGRLGLAYSKMNKHELALDAYKKAIEIEPENVDYQNNMKVTEERLQQQQSGAGSIGASEGLFPGLNPNIDFAAALNNPALVQMASRMMTDPNIQNLLSQLSGMQNVDSLVETGRQLAQNLASQNPDLIANIRRQLDPDNNSSNNDNQPPPGTN